MIAPAHLTGSQSELWVELEQEFDLGSPQARELLEAAVVHLAQAKEAAAMVDREGLMIDINAGKTRIAHPLLRVERDSRVLAGKCLGELRAKFPSRGSVRVAKSSPRRKRGE